jgi:nitrogen fixation-related uncharacterized protein
MKLIEVSLVLGAVAVLVLWRGVALYQYAFKRKEL